MSIRSYRYFRPVLWATLAGLLFTSGFANAQKVLRIGAPFELSGKFVTFGEQGRRGLEMATEAFGGTVAGHKIEALLRDVQSSNSGTVSAMTDLLEKEKVEYMIGPMGSEQVSAAVPAWRKRKPLWVVPGSSAPTFEKAIAGEAMVFHTFPWGDEYSAAPAKAIAAAVGKGKKVAFLYTDGAYGRANFAVGRVQYSQAGFEIVAEELVRENSHDMNPALQKIRLAKPDVLVCIMQTTDGIVAAKQIYVAKMGIPILSSTGFVQYKYWADAVGEAGNGWIGGTSYLPGQVLAADPKYPKIFPAAKDWEAAFRKKYNREPELVDALVYTSAAMLFLAVERAGGPDDKEKVAKELHNLGVHTILGESQFEPSAGGALNQAFSKMFAFQRQGDKYVTIWPSARANGQLQLVK